jgi:hypothetical protein
MKTTRPLAALAAALFVSACAGHGGGLDSARFNSPDFGASVRNNIEAESVPADPAAVNSPVEADGARQSLAQARYHTDHVKQPSNPATSSIATGSGGEGASGGGGGGASTGTSGGAGGY